MYAQPCDQLGLNSLRNKRDAENASYSIFSLPYPLMQKTVTSVHPALRETSPSPSKSRVIRKSSYREAHLFTLFGRMTLYEHKLVFSAWSLRGRSSRELVLQDVVRVRWRRKKGPNLIFILKDGARFSVRAKGPAIWHYILEAQLKARTVKPFIQKEASPHRRLGAWPQSPQVNQREQHGVFF